MGHKFFFRRKSESILLCVRFQTSQYTKVFSPKKYHLQSRYLEPNWLESVCSHMWKWCISRCLDLLTPNEWWVYSKCQGNWLPFCFFGPLLLLAKGCLNELLWWRNLLRQYSTIASKLCITGKTKPCGITVYSAYKM